jgi:hypothetical protein
VPQTDPDLDGERCFLPDPPLARSKALAQKFDCDLAVPCHTGLGNIMMYSRLVDDLARRWGRPLRLLTGPIRTFAGSIQGEDAYPVWAENPHVESIVDPSGTAYELMRDIEREQDNLCQFGHVIENLAFHYGLRPSAIRPSLYLSRAEAAGALERLQELPRPLICIHPYGTSSPPEGHPWHRANWLQLSERLRPLGSMFEIGIDRLENKSLGLPRFRTTIREMMALVWASDIFVGFDSSIAHVATAFQRPAAVLWEPLRKVEIEERFQRGFAAAVLSRWGYPHNRNLVLLGDRDDEIVSLVEEFVTERLRSMGW